jgi:hypothetical protein
MAKSILITSRPGGGAPEEIRDKWVGLILPVNHDYSGIITDVRTHRVVGETDGYAVRWEDAMKALDDEARAWWEFHVIPLPNLIFPENCCEVIG